MHSLRPIPLIFSAATGLVLVSGCRRSAPEGNVTVRRPNEVEFTATVHSRPFDSGWVMPGYHAVVWRGGRMAHPALFRAEVSDRQVISALEDLGAKPGNNLVMEAWTERKNPTKPEPDTVIRGSPVEVLVRLPRRSAAVPLSTILLDSGGRGIEMRYGGNEENIPKWKSGCIVCLYSCPGSKVGNARYTERDYANRVTRFRVKPGLLPEDGTPVRVVLRLIPPR